MIDNFLELEKRHLSLSQKRQRNVSYESGNVSPAMFLSQCWGNRPLCSSSARNGFLQQKTEFVVAINLFNVNSNGRIIERLQKKKKNQWDICFTWFLYRTCIFELLYKLYLCFFYVYASRYLTVKRNIALIA